MPYALHLVDLWPLAPVALAAVLAIAVHSAYSPGRLDRVLRSDVAGLFDPGPRRAAGRPLVGIALAMFLQAGCLVLCFVAIGYAVGRVMR